MKEPLLSILVPVYNVAPYLRRCMNSLVSQTYTNIEIICVDDGSTDNSLEILREYEEKDSRIIIIHKENGGLVSARKAAMKVARGEYVGYVDSDDWVEPIMFNRMMNVAINENADIVCCSSFRDYKKYTYEEINYFSEGLYSIEQIINPEFGGGLVSLEELNKFYVSPHVWDKIYRKEIVYANQLAVPDEITDGEDMACVWPTILDGKRIGMISDCLYHYVLRDSSMSFKSRNVDYTVLFDYLTRSLKARESICSSIMKQTKLQEVSCELLGSTSQILKYRKDELFPFGKIFKGSRILIYGNGRFGKNLRACLEEMGLFEIIGVVDKYQENEEIIEIGKLKEIDYDVLLIGILKADLIREVKYYLMSIGVEEKKIMSVDINLILH